MVLCQFAQSPDPEPKPEPPKPYLPPEIDPTDENNGKTLKITSKFKDNTYKNLPVITKSFERDDKTMILNFNGLPYYYHGKSSKSTTDNPEYKFEPVKGGMQKQITKQKLKDEITAGKITIPGLIPKWDVTVPKSGKTKKGSWTHTLTLSAPGEKPIEIILGKYKLANTIKVLSGADTNRLAIKFQVNNDWVWKLFSIDSYNKGEEIFYLKSYDPILKRSASAPNVQTVKSTPQKTSGGGLKSWIGKQAKKVFGEGEPKKEPAPKKKDEGPIKTGPRSLTLKMTKAQLIQEGKNDRIGYVKIEKGKGKIIPWGPERNPGKTKAGTEVPSGVEYKSGDQYKSWPIVIPKCKPSVYNPCPPPPKAKAEYVNDGDYYEFDEYYDDIYNEEYDGYGYYGYYEDYDDYDDYMDLYDYYDYYYQYVMDLLKSIMAYNKH